MFDVHPAHHAASNWREFFIHIATIVLGLLIAVVLEQTVESIHHRRQRDELTENMREEAEHSLPVIRESLVRLQTQRLYIKSLRSDCSSRNAAGRITIESRQASPISRSHTVTTCSSN